MQGGRISEKEESNLLIKLDLTLDCTIGQRLLEDTGDSNKSSFYAHSILPQATCFTLFQDKAKAIECTWNCRCCSFL